MPRFTREQLGQLWQDIVGAVRERDSFYIDRVPRESRARPPATADELAALERHLHLRLPPSYADFLLLNNGVDNFIDDCPLLSTHDIIQGPGAWVETVEEIEEALARFPVAGSDHSDAGFFVFDTGKVADDGEMELVHFSQRADESRWPSFGEYLISFLGAVRATVENERRDREGLHD